MRCQNCTTNGASGYAVRRVGGGSGRRLDGGKGPTVDGKDGQPHRKETEPLGGGNDDAQGLAFDLDDYGPLILGTA